MNATVASETTLSCGGQGYRKIDFCYGHYLPSVASPALPNDVPGTRIFLWENGKLTPRLLELRRWVVASIAVCVMQTASIR